MSIRRVLVALCLGAGCALGGGAEATDAVTEAREQAALSRLSPGEPEDSLMKTLVAIEEEFPDSAAAAPKVLALLRDERVKVRRKAVRVLGVLQPNLDAPGLADVTRMLASPDTAEVVDALKGLGGLYAPASIPSILPLLASPNEHVKREACRTLALVADRSVLARIEPLTKDPIKDVRNDAEGAVAQLRRKP
jgi:HEAT repeat protein